jgi:7-cyano-7-deazaguanine synthase|tara:strand:+ start:208 stop:909 length:702 start_codon:yes stop_codon:yes gene_type:complete
MDKVLVVLSGGLDSSVATMMCVDKYGKDNVQTVTFDYNQKQKLEIEKASDLCKELEVKHTILDLSVLGTIAQPMSANISGTEVDMPNIKEVLGDPQPVTYVPFRNMILLSIAMSHAEVQGCNKVITGLQVHDEYGYWDTTQKFVDTMNVVASQNRTHSVEIEAPFSQMSKAEEIEVAIELGQFDLLRHTLTCYNPQGVLSCGKCPSCAERIMNFMKVGRKDPIPYDIDIDWKI